MRKIKFRFWNPREKEMQYPDNVANGVAWDVFGYMQYTWCEDKNWKEIYEWDILQIQAWDKHYELLEIFFISGVDWWIWKWTLMWNDDLLNNSYEMFEWAGVLSMCDDAAFDSACDGNIINFEVIWNIYENPKLLPHQW